MIIDTYRKYMILYTYRRYMKIDAYKKIHIGTKHGHTHMVMVCYEAINMMYCKQTS
jgi:hypothetical protein